ncbi:hypothetical protein ACFPZI_14655 [Streptomyces chlorus]|uniref:Uncharacterized protein n=1 Tax=Streptomyces chlorus TaxID=887452 RepID=A0ABW1DZE0_9ACTN
MSAASPAAQHFDELAALARKVTAEARCGEHFETISMTRRAVVQARRRPPAGTELQGRP